MSRLAVVTVIGLGLALAGCRETIRHPDSLDPKTRAVLPRTDNISGQVR